MKHESEVEFVGGPYSAIFTPFDASNRVNHEMLEQIGQFQFDKGVRGFFAAGSTGEGLLLSSEERTDVIRTLVNRFSGKAKVIAHVGHPSTEEAVRLAKLAADAGADWIASIAPIFYGNSAAGTFRHYKAISNATELPFMIYALGGAVDPARDLALFELPNVCGLKYTGANFYSVQQLMRHVDRPVALMSGFDEQFIAGQSFGFSGGIGSTYNFGPEFYSGIFENYHQGNVVEAARLQAKINSVTALMVEYENWSYRKAIMKYIGFDCGHCRLPYEPISDQDYAEFAARLDELGVLGSA